MLIPLHQRYPNDPTCDGSPTGTVVGRPFGLQLSAMAAQYEALAADLARMIANGTLAPGSRLPSIPELAEARGISQSSVRLAFQALLAAGLVTTHPGKGTFVRMPIERTRLDDRRYQEAKDRAASPAVNASEPDVAPPAASVSIVDMLGRSQAPFEVAIARAEADEDLAERFQVEPGHPLLERVYRVVDADRVSLVRSYIRVDDVEGNPDVLDESLEPWVGGTFAQLRSVGIEIDRVVDDVIARPPTLTEGELFGAGGGLAVLEIRSSRYDVDGRVVEIVFAVHPGDRTMLRYSTQLDRWAEA